MPGTRLSSNEKKLLLRWQKPTDNSNFLRSITIDTNDPNKPAAGLRGIMKAHIEFNYPITVLVGPNGSGKSTILNLAALAFRGKSYIPSGRQTPGYRFPDFFFAIGKETQPTNFTINWSIKPGKSSVKNTKMVRRSTRKWMDYERRHAADVVHIGLSRIASLSESGPHKRAFGTKKKEKPVAHDSWITGAMSSVFSRKYSESTSIPAGRFAVPQVETSSGGNYSAFNMGTGEAAVFAILEEIAKCPRGTLILIEEIEMAIHPSAQAKLAQVLVDRALDQDLQVVCTSHSRWFVDALPREARILVQPSGDKHICISNITTRLAEGALLGRHQEELLVICEDPVGQMIIESALPMNLRSRVKIVPCGSKSELGRAATYTHLTNPSLPILIVWDGDATDVEIRAAFETADGGKHLKTTNLIEWTRIGGQEIMDPSHVHIKTDAPEHQIKHTLTNDEESLIAVAAAFDTDVVRVGQMLESAAVEDGSHHRLFDDIQLQTGTTLDFVGRTLSRAYVESLRSAAGAELPLVIAIERMLAGVRLGFTQPWKLKEEVDPAA